MSIAFRLYKRYNALKGLYISAQGNTLSTLTALSSFCYARHGTGYQLGQGAARSYNGRCSVPRDKSRGYYRLSLRDKEGRPSRRDATNIAQGFNPGASKVRKPEVALCPAATSFPLPPAFLFPALYFSRQHNKVFDKTKTWNYLTTVRCASCRFRIPFIISTEISKRERYAGEEYQQ
ncbi:MAG: hypothetical protein Q3M24_06365 [Candidatus Electrothrix aestuarii]|uniref:Uncharacterized protein n=1 Tax=Candidatus Electrothrix aestuarii TaxID=3062594 RepID=A0AAU8LYK8_9BACT